MENKKYLDKVLEHMLKNTKIKGSVADTPFILTNHLHSPFHHHQTQYMDSPKGITFMPQFNKLFYDYCGNYFGLTHDEIIYVWNQYKDIIENGQ